MSGRGWRVGLVLAAPALLAVVVGVMALAGRDAGDGARVASPQPEPGATATTLTGEPVEIEATSTVQATTLAELVAASDSVVIGRVAATERGRLVGADAEGAGGIVTRLVRLEVDEVLAGEATGDEVVVEEAGWLADGTPVLVNGVEGSAEGDLGIWFLVRGVDEQFPYWAVLNDQGRYLVDPSDETRFRDVPVADVLIDRLESQDPIILRHQVQEVEALLAEGDGGAGR